MIEMDGVRQAAGALGLRAFLTSLEIAGGTCVAQNVLAMFDGMRDGREIGSQLGNKRNRIWRGWLGRIAAALDRQPGLLPGGHTAVQDRDLGVSGDLEGPVDARSGAEITGGRARTDDHDMTCR